MATALWPLQQAMYAQATADTALSGLVTGVFDEVPAGQAYPYVSLGSVTELPRDVHNRRGVEVGVVWHVWSKYRGWREAAEIAAALEAVFDRQPLTVTGWTDVSVAAQEHRTVADPDPDIRHINARYRVWLTKEE